MVQKLWPFAGVMALVLASRAPAGTSAPFYEGKTVRIIVGFAAGGASTPRPGPSPGTWAGISPAAR